MSRRATVYMTSLLLLNCVTGTLLFTPTCTLASFSQRKSRASRSVIAVDGSNDTSYQLLVLRGGASSDEPGAGGVDSTEASPLAEESPPVLSAPSEIPRTVTGIVKEQPESSATQLLGPKAPEPGPIRRALPRFPWHRLPDALTYLRCLAIPLLVWVFHLPGRHVATASVFALASLTDFLDGYLARRWDITSSFGAFLDPVADKLMVSTALVLLSGRYGAKVAIPTALILGREIAVSALREWMAQRGKRDTVQVGMQGKIKTALSMVALTLYLLVPVSGSEKLDLLREPAQILLYLSAGITVTSCWAYFQAASPTLRD